MRGGASFESGALDGWQFGGNVILAKNTTGQSVARWGVMKITGIEIDPNDGDKQELSFGGMPCVTGGDASGGAGEAFGIAIEPIKNDKVGRIAVDGVVQVTAETLGLIRGAVQVLWEDGDWAIVRLGGGGGVRLGKTTATWTKGTLATIELYEQGTPPSETRNPSPYTLENCVNKFADVQSGKWVMVAKASNVLWYLIAAEC